MTTVNIAPLMKMQFNQNGVPVAGGKLFTYAAGTTNKLATYKDSTGNTPNTNPIILDSNGQCDCWLTSGSAYKFVLSPSFDSDPPQASFWTQDNIVGVNDLQNNGAANIGFTQLGTGAVSRTVQSKEQDVISVKDFNAKGDGTTDDSAAFASSQPSMIVPRSTGAYVIATNTTCSADLIFSGGVITVNSGVTLTLNGNVIASSEVIFKGAGTVVINRGVIDVTWFDGATGDAKWNFARRMLSNTGHHIFRFPQVSSTDPHAINTSLGWAWNLAAPLYLDNTASTGDGDSIITIYTEGPFAASVNIAAVWYMGHNTSKVDVVNFPMEIRAYDLSTNHIASVYRNEGGGHHNVAGISAWGCGNAIWLNPQGTDQVNDVKIGYLYCAGLTDRAVRIEGTAGANNTVTDCEIGFINCDGFNSAAGVDALVHISGTVTGFKIGKVTLRGITSVAGYVDASTATVLVENTASYAPGYLVEIGSILNGSNPAQAKCLVVRDTSSGTGPKIGGIVLNGGVQGSVSPQISLDYCTGAQIAAGLQANVTIDATCQDTHVFATSPTNVTDTGVNTLINGANHGAIVGQTVGSSPVNYTNNNKYPVDYQLQGGTVTTVNFVRGATTLTVYSGTSLNAGMFRLSPGDQIQYAFSVAPTANIIPR